MSRTSVVSNMDTGGLESSIREDAITQVFGTGPPMQQQLIPFVAAAIKKEADSPRRSLTADQLVSVFNGLQNYDVDHSKGTLSLTHLSINFTGDKGKLNNSMDHTVYMQTGSQGPVHFVLAKSKKNLIEDRLKVRAIALLLRTNAWQEGRWQRRAELEWPLLAKQLVPLGHF